MSSRPPGRSAAGSEEAGEPTPDAEDRLRLDFRVDAWLTLSPLRHGPADPTIRFSGGGVLRATRTRVGPATLAVRPLGGRGDEWLVRAWGPGAMVAVGGVPRLLGADDEPARLRLPNGPLRRLATRLAGLRLCRTDAVLEALVPAIIEQKVTGPEAQRAYRRLVMRHGQPAPGPGGLRLPPEGATLAGLPAWALHPIGLEERRALTLRRAGERAARLEAAGRLGPETTRARLLDIPGVGPWTAAETTRTALGDPDALSVGDFHTPSLVAWALTGAPRADDARMLELLEPYRGQRARLVRLLELSGLQPPRYGPRLSPRRIERL